MLCWIDRLWTILSFSTYFIRCNGNVLLRLVSGTNQIFILSVEASTWPVFMSRASFGIEAKRDNSCFWNVFNRLEQSQMIMCLCFSTTFPRSVHKRYWNRYKEFENKHFFLQNLSRCCCCSCCCWHVFTITFETKLGIIILV